MSKIRFNKIGSGIVLAAAGVGAGDMIASGVSGATFGLTLLWALILGAFFKYILNEGMARYQLATGRTFMEAFSRRNIWFNYYFISYLVIWSFVVGGALLSGIGLVTNAMFPWISLKLGAVLCAVVVWLVVLTEKYDFFERIMQVLAGVMFLTFVVSAIMVFPSFWELIKGLLIPTLPVVDGGFFKSIFTVLALMGGVGGTVTIMAYSYWIREKNISSTKDLLSVRFDLAISYFVTFLFGMCVMIIAAAIIHPAGGSIAGSKGILELAKGLSLTLGPFGFWSFVIGFWAAVFSSLMSFYQGIPYLFADAVRIVKGTKERINMSNKYYRWYVIYCVFPPMVLLFLNKPVFLILTYSVLGAFFMPFLALMLLIVGGEKKLGKFKNSNFYNVVLSLIIVLMSIISFWPLIIKYVL